MMQYSKDGLHLTEQFEGCKLEAYPDPGSGGTPWTIGYGHTGPEVNPGMKITQTQAEDLLMRDVQKAVNAVNALVRVRLSQQEFDALVDFVFNVGRTNFQNSTLLRLLNAGNYKGAAEQFDDWDMSHGKHMAGLLRRRIAERDEFLSGMK